MKREAWSVAGTARAAVLTVIMAGWAVPVLAQPQVPAAPGPVELNVVSEWDATAFNNGRRIVRDANGYFHAFWHNRADENFQQRGPIGEGAHIFYSRTVEPADEPPSMAAQYAWTGAVNLTELLTSETPLGYKDHRYPSAAIEYEVIDGEWRTINKIHLVWQALLIESEHNDEVYEVLYASLPVDEHPGAPAMPFMSALILSETWVKGGGTDSLVPSISINRYVDESVALQQNIHVVWQEEDIHHKEFGLPAGRDEPFSDIAYMRSSDSGQTWAGPDGGWTHNHRPFAWDNLTQTAANSQLPSVACILDQYTGAPGRPERDELGYNSEKVHLAYHEDEHDANGVPVGIHVHYLRSDDNGESWMFGDNVTTATAVNTGSWVGAYPSLAVDMLDRPHIAWMIGDLVPAEPLRCELIDPGLHYLAGIHPLETRSFPGPNPGMYGDVVNRVAVFYEHDDGTGGTWDGQVLDPTTLDDEFPTIALDRWMNINVSLQRVRSDYHQPTPDPLRPVYYDVVRYTRTRQVPFLLTLPPEPPIYLAWAGPHNESVMDGPPEPPPRDDLFPSLAIQRTALYAAPCELRIPQPPAIHPIEVGFDHVWTRLAGRSAVEAVLPPYMPWDHSIYQNGNMTWEDPTPAEMQVWTLTMMHELLHDDPADADAGTDFGPVIRLTSENSQLMIMNVGVIPLEIGPILVADDVHDQFEVLFDPAALLLTVTFDPTEYGAAAARVLITNNTLDDPFVLNLAGVGAYRHTGLHAGAGTMTPDGATPVVPGATLSVELEADFGHYIGLCQTNTVHVAGVVGLLDHTVTWENVRSDITTEANFLNTAGDTAPHNTPIPWLRRFYTDEIDWNALALRALQDTDDDGALGWQEHVANTDPTDQGSVFRVTEATTPPYRVHFESSVERLYTLMGRPDLTDGDWQAVTDAGPRAGVDGPDAFEDPNDPPEGPFYRVQVELP